MKFLGVVISGSLAAAICFLVIRWLHPAAVRLGLIDHPGERRKLHRHAVPPIGGVALFSGVLAATLLATQVTGLLSGPPLDGLGAGLTGAALLVTVGLLDDRFGLGFRVRLLAQLIAVLILALIDASQSASSIAPVIALWFVAIPLLDTLNVMGRRLRCGRSPFKADRGVQGRSRPPASPASYADALHR